MKKLAWAFASIALCAASAAAAQPAPPSPVAGVTLEIGAEGEVKARPDMASLDLGVSVSASSAKAALGEAGARMSRLLAALKDAGIADRDIATAEISLSPQYAYQQGEAPR
ncbi:MAG: SIMPL domain-containing protein, partial [Caulobacteraceae bacterium]